MKLHHIAYWSQNIDALTAFYVRHWNARVLFRNRDGDFSCAFIEAFGCVKLEIMNRTNIPRSDRTERTGYSHLSIEVDSKREVDRITDYCVANGIPLEKNKAQYDDGFYESSFVDPDGNVVEIAFVDRKVNPQV